MRRLFITIIPVLILTAFSSKDVEQQNQSKSEFEQAVFYEIFPSLIDSIHTDRRLIPPPPPEYFKFMDSVGSNTEITERSEKWKKSAQYKKWLVNWEKKKDSIGRGTTPIYLTIPDSTGRTDENDIRELIEHFGDHNIATNSFEISN